MAGSSPFTVVTNIFVTEFAFRENSIVLEFSHETTQKAFTSYGSPPS